MKTKLLKKIFKTVLVIATMGLFLSNTMAVFGQSLTGVQPNQGMQGQTIELLVSGQNTNFMQASNVSVRLQQGTSTLIYPYQTNVVSNLQLSSTFGIAFSNEPGYYDIRVYNEIDGEMILEDAFQIIENPDQPELISIEPDIAEKGQTLNLLVSGQFTHFQASNTTVWLQQGTGTIYPNYFQTLNNSELLPNFTFNNYLPVGLYDLHTNNSIDGELVLENSFTLLPGFSPNITEMQPSTAIQGSLLGFDIYGDNTHFEDASIVLAYLENSNNQIIELLFDNQYQIWTNEQIEGAIIIPYNSSPGIYDLHVYNNIDGSLVLPQAFSVNPNSESPEILSINPTSCYTGQEVIVDVQAQNTWFDWSNELYVSLKKSNSNERIWATSFQIENLDQLSAQFNIPLSASAGLWDFTISDDICGEMVLEGSMTVIDTIAGTNKYEEQSALKLFPNPAKGHFKLSTPHRLEECKVIIYNLSGQRKEFDNITFLPNQPVQFNIQNLSDGFYFVQIISYKETLIKKLIKQ